MNNYLKVYYTSVSELKGLLNLSPNKNQGFMEFPVDHLDQVENH